MTFQKQPSRGLLRIRSSENIQQVYRRTPMLKCFATLLKPHFGMCFLLSICSVVSDQLFLRTPLEGCLKMVLLMKSVDLVLKIVSFMGPFKNDVTAKMLNFRAPSPYVTVSHFFHYTPSPHGIRQIMTKFFLHQGPFYTYNNFAHFV